MARIASRRKAEEGNVIIDEPTSPAPNRIKDVRMRRGMSLSELSELTGLTRSELHKLEKGVRRIRTDHLPPLAKALRCTPEELLSPDLVKQLLGNRSSFGQAQGEAATTYKEIVVLGKTEKDGQFYINEETPIARVAAPLALSEVAEAYAIYMPTVRLEPRIPVASLLYVNPVLPARPGDVAVARYPDGRALLVQVERDAQGMLAGRLFMPNEMITFAPSDNVRLQRVIGVMFS